MEGTYYGKKVPKFHNIIPATIAQKRIHQAYLQFWPLEGWSLALVYSCNYFIINLQAPSMPINIVFLPVLVKPPHCVWFRLHLPFVGRPLFHAFAPGSILHPTIVIGSFGLFSGVFTSTLLIHLTRSIPLSPPLVSCKSIPNTAYLLSAQPALSLVCTKKLKSILLLIGAYGANEPRPCVTDVVIVQRKGRADGEQASAGLAVGIADGPPLDWVARQCFTTVFWMHFIKMNNLCSFVVLGE